MYDEAAPQDQKTLRAELAKAQDKLDGLVRDLRAVDAELEELAPEQHRYRLLTQVCVSLEELDGIGAAELFWDGRATNSEAQTHLIAVRGRVDTFQKRLDEIEVRRQAIVESLEHAEEAADWIEHDIENAERKAEERANEWVIERDLGELPLAISVMPWTRGGEDDRQFRRNLAGALLLSLLLGVIFPMIDLPIPEAWKVEEVPERFTNLIERKIELPPPPPPVVEEVVPEEAEPEPVDELIAEEPAPKSEAQPEPQKTAESKGILAFREKFSGLVDDQPAAKLGAMAKINNAGEAASGRPERSMVTTNAPGSSGGINLANLSRDTGGGGGGQIEGVQVARATSSIGSGTGGTGRPLAGGGAGLGRTDEEIQIVFDRHKSALYRLYNRELRKNPTLRGQMVLRLTIEPDGSVSLCKVQSTDMKAPQLASEVVGRVQTFDFGAKEVPAVTILYPIDFLPAT